MLQVNRQLVVVDTLEDIIVKLRDDVYTKTEKLYFSRMKPSGKSLQVTCPFHKGGQERTPSCGILRENGLFHCFTCQTVASLPEAISHCFGKTDDGSFGERWLSENCTIARIDDRSLSDLPRREKVKEKLTYVTEEELEKYRYSHDYMYKRGLTDDIIEQFDIGFDPNFKLKREDGTLSQAIPCITFPVRDKAGNCLFVARRSIEGKLFHYPMGAEKPVYGLYELFRDTYIGEIDGKFHALKELIICESVFNALSCWKYGIPALALLGTGNKEQHNVLRRLPIENLYLGFDPDEAGDNGTNRLLQNIKRTGIRILDVPQGKDLNDLTETEFWDMERLTVMQWKDKYFS